MFEKRKLASAVAAAIGASVTAVGVAQAEVGSVMFPSVVASPTVTTVISLVNDGDGIFINSGNKTEEVLHYTYWHKELESNESIAEFNVKPCLHRDRYLPTSFYDLVTFDLSGQFFGDINGVMFNDESVKVSLKGDDWILYEEAPKPQRGVLFVDNYDLQDLENYKKGDGVLAGEAVLFEVSTGAAWGYQGFSIVGRSGMFSDFNSGRRSRIPFMPPAEVTTLILATPTLDPETGDPVNQIEQQGNLTALVGVRGNTIDGGGIWDREENFSSAGTDQKVTCVGGWQIEDLFSDASASDGGWTHITNYMDPTGTGYTGDTVSPAAIVFKVEYGDVENLDAANNRVPGTGLWNNGFYLHPDPANGDTSDGG
jgi:hypothetical protein